MPDTTTARVFLISGMVQGVGYRFFARGAAQRLGVSGYAKNLGDGRVEVYAIGTPGALAALRTELARGPRFASVSGVDDEERAVDSRYADRFTIERDDW
ncbi:MAG: acylphosphatase [Candidatus Acidiferrales bacterium]